MPRKSTYGELEQRVKELERRQHFDPDIAGVLEILEIKERLDPEKEGNIDV